MDFGYIDKMKQVLIEQLDLLSGQTTTNSQTFKVTTAQTWNDLSEDEAFSPTLAIIRN